MYFPFEHGHIFLGDMLVFWGVPSLKLTAIAPENGWLEYDRFLFGWPLFRGEMLVSGRAFHKPI